MGLDARKPVFRGGGGRGLATTHAQTIICEFATGEISIFWLVSVAEETGCWKPKKTDFIASRPV